MSSDDFGTINVRRGGERAREIEVLRQHYRRHRDALQRMTEDAPTEHLASEYGRLIGELDRSLSKLEELEGLTPAAPTAPPSPEPTRPHGDPLADQRPRNATPGMKPVAAAAPPPPGRVANVPPAPPHPGRAGNTPPVPPPHPARAGLDNTIPESDAVPRSRLPLIVGAAVLALAIIGALMWRASSGRESAGAIVEERPAAEGGTTAGTTAVSDTSLDTEAGTAAADDTIEPAAPPIRSALGVTPPSHDFGVVRKGTRATRKYQIANNTDEPMTLDVARSACRCLFYVHAPVIPPRAKETLTVTLDGARAKAGTLEESVRVSSKSDASVRATINLTATVR